MKKAWTGLARVPWACGWALSVVLTPGMLLAQAAPAPARVASLTINSPNLKDGGAIPNQFTCAAGPASGSPEISWTGVPAEAKSVVVYLHDLDPHPNGGASDVLHWLVWNIPASQMELPAGIKNEAAAVPGSVQGTNTHGSVGYYGPCPPPGSADHHYVFEVFALNKSLDLSPKASRAELLNAIDGSIVGHGVLVIRKHVEKCASSAMPTLGFAVSPMMMSISGVSQPAASRRSYPSAIWSAI